MNSQQDLKGRFVNPHATEPRRNAWQVFLWLVGYYKDVEATESPPQDFAFPAHIATQGGGQILWIGHSTFLIQEAGISVLTDPVWSNRASPFSCIGPKRQRPPGLTLKELPPVDYILISHNHYDHLDIDTCIALHKAHTQALFVVPLGLKRWFVSRGIRHVEELDWWQEVNHQVRVTAVPSQHFSGRGFFDRDQSLWCGYILEIGQKCLYFAGDTGYNTLYFQEIGKRFAKIDLSLLPIGGYAPREFMRSVHINPQEAVQIHLDVGSKLSIGCHYGTFRLSDEPLERPSYDLFLALEEKKIRDFILMKMGEQIAW